MHNRRRSSASSSVTSERANGMAALMLAMSENRRDEMEFRREEREREDRRFMSEREDRVRKDLLFLRAFGIDSRE